MPFHNHRKEVAAPTRGVATPLSPQNMTDMADRKTSVMHLSCSETLSRTKETRVHFSPMTDKAPFPRLFYTPISSRKTLEKRVYLSYPPCGTPQKRRLGQAKPPMTDRKTSVMHLSCTVMDSRKDTPPRRHPQGNDRGRGDAYQKANTAKFKPLVPKSGASQAGSPPSERHRQCSRATNPQNYRPTGRETAMTRSTQPQPTPSTPPSKPTILECPKCRQRVIVQLTRFTAVCLPCGRRMEGAHK